MSIINSEFELNITVKVWGRDKLKLSDIGRGNKLTCGDIVPIEYKLTLSRWWQVSDRDGMQRIACIDVGESELTRLHLIVGIFRAVA